MSERKIGRKEFIGTVTLTTFGTVLLRHVVYADILLKQASGNDLASVSKDNGLRVLSDRPWLIETPAHLLDDKVTPSARIFVRNNGLAPENIDTTTWKLSIGGESVIKPLSFSLVELKSKFQHFTYQLTIECAGNGRSEFRPGTPGGQWTTGAVACPLWTGVRLKDILNMAGLKNDAVYIGFYGKDRHLSGDSEKVVISRGVPISKAMEDESLVAWAVNGKDLPLQNGYPLRLVFGGWPASASGKWLHKIVVRNKVHDGPKMGGTSYRIPCSPIKPGSEVSEDEMCIIESMPVKSLITYPKSGAVLRGKKSLNVRGHAWAGDLKVKAVEVSVDFGSTWQKCMLEEPVN